MIEVDSTYSDGVIGVLVIVGYVYIFVDGGIDEDSSGVFRMWNIVIFLIHYVCDYL